MEEKDVPPTQLADSRPKLDDPLRVSIPVNAPVRVAKVSQDQYIRSNAFSPAALSHTRQVLPSLLLGGKSVADKVRTSSAATTGGDADNAAIKTAISDFTVLAFSSRRSGKKDVEATAHVSLGVIYDNQGNFTQALESYRAYAAICEEIGDVAGLACACNCQGVDLMLQACPSSDAGLLRGFGGGDEGRAQLAQAVAQHTRHLEVVPDAGGKFVANTNLGLCLGMLGDVAKAAKHHQEALRIAIKMQTLYGQALAVGNLGLLATLKRDWATARTCLEQHLQLVQALLDADAEINAWKLLAALSSMQDNHALALENLDQARRVAAREGHHNELRRINCLVGVATAGRDFETYAGSLVGGAV